MGLRDVNSVHTLQVAVGALSAFGLDAARELQRAGIGAPPDERAPVARAAYCALWARIAQVAGRDEVGFEVAGTIQRGTLGPLEWLAMTADTVEEGLRKLARYGRLLHSGGHYALELRGRHACFVYHAGESPVHRATLDWSLAYLASAVRRAVPGTSPIVEMRLQYPRPRHAARVEEAFGARVRFSAALNEIVLVREALDQPLATRDPDVHAALETVCRARCAPHGESALVPRVAATIRVALEREETPTLESVAKSLAMGARSLQRSLQGSGTSFRDLLLGARMELADRWLSVPGQSVSEVGYRLGYSEPSVLIRAYRSYFGRSWRSAGRGSLMIPRPR